MTLKGDYANRDHRDGFGIMRGTLSQSSGEVIAKRGVVGGEKKRARRGARRVLC